MNSDHSVEIISLVVSNGLGHFRRQVEILSRVLEKAPAARIHLLCARFQYAITRDWDLAVRFFADPRVTWSEGILDPGVGWSVDSQCYDDGRLAGWTERLKNVPQLQTARLVISDNLAGVLAYRNDAILAGSFLWSDILATAHPGSEAVRAFAQRENELLARHKPMMICVRDIAMPAVMAQTRPVPMDWMCEHEVAPQPASAPVPRIGLLGGASGAADALLGRLARALARTGRYELALPASLAGAVERSVPFRHRREDYAALSLAICRSGIGTVTACITEGVPMITIHEGRSNPELSHVGQRLESLRAALHAGADPEDGVIIAAVEKILREPARTRMHETLVALPRNGLDQAAAFLLARLG